MAAVDGAIRNFIQIGRNSIHECKIIDSESAHKLNEALRDVGDAGNIIW